MIPRLGACLCVLVLMMVGLAPSAVGQQAQPAVAAQGAVLWDPADSVVLFGRAVDEPRPMASTTKIMTVLLALEAGAIDETLVVSAHAVRIGQSPGAARLGLRPGQRIAVRSVLAGLILRSGNDGAVAVAEHLAGTEEAFVQKMNARAREMGLTGTAFLDSSGLASDSRHHASPRDLARLAAVAMADPNFRIWAGADRMEVPGLGVLENRNELIGTYPGATGVKTGYTNLAGLCLVASATRDGRTLYAVVLGSRDSFAEASALLDYGFRAYQRPAPVVGGQQVATYRWSGAQVSLVAAEPLARTVTGGSAVTWRVILDPLAPRPVPAGASLGRAELFVGGHVVDSTALHAAEAVPAPAPGSRGDAAGAAVHDTLRAFARLHAVFRQVIEGPPTHT
ncbi:MAG: D-alanyl-D-alanine carboxypeptidase family protein [Egibacteraceae bacterium]